MTTFALETPVYHQITRLLQNYSPKSRPGETFSGRLNAGLIPNPDQDVTLAKIDELRYGNIPNTGAQETLLKMGVV